MNQIIKLGQMDNSDGTFESANRVYSQEGISPTIPTCTSGGSQPKVLEIRGGKNVETILIKQATKTGYVECDIGGVADLNYVISKTRRGRVIEQGNICPTLTTENLPSVIEKWIWELDGVKYLIRIRKLTPRECWRLMDFEDEDYKRASEKVSQTQQYKQAGNSIVRNCLVALLGQMIPDHEDDYKGV